MGPSPLGHILRWACQSRNPPSPVISRDEQGSLCSAVRFRTGTALTSHAEKEPPAMLRWGYLLFPPLLPHIVKPLVANLPSLELLLTQKQPAGNHIHTPAACFRVHHNTSSPKGLPSQGRETRTSSLQGHLPNSFPHPASEV